jgi:hypothetical protein
MESRSHLKIRVFLALERGGSTKRYPGYHQTIFIFHTMVVG